MAIDPTKIIRDVGEVSIGGSGLGALDPFEGDFSLKVMWEGIPIAPLETGVLARMLHAGYTATARVVAGEKNAAVMTAAFNDYASGAGFALDDDTYVPGADITGVAFSFVGRTYTITASNACVTIDEEMMNVGVPQQPQYTVLKVQFMAHSDGSVLTVALTS